MAKGLACREFDKFIPGHSCTRFENFFNKEIPNFSINKRVTNVCLNVVRELRCKNFSKKIVMVVNWCKAKVYLGCPIRECPSFGEVNVLKFMHYIVPEVIEVAIWISVKFFLEKDKGNNPASCNSKLVP